MIARDLSVLLPTYAGDDPDHLATAIESCFEQTVEPAALLIVEDGPLTPALATVLDAAQRAHPDTVVRHALDENTGLGNALRVGVEQCSNPLIARLDADDRNRRRRFERQLDFLDDNPEVDVVGGYIAEFVDDPADPVAYREVPAEHAAIRRLARFRSPMNHGTVVFRREAVLAAGNYRAVRRMEDYDLWVRMLCSGATFANLPEVLVDVRTDGELAGRRGGLEYARAELARQVEFYRRGFTSLPVCLFNVATRTSLRLVPNRLRAWIYRRVARDAADTAGSEATDPGRRDAEW